MRKYKNQDNQNENVIKNSVNFSEKLRSNIWKYAEDNGMTVVDIANNSNIPINTLNSFLYHSANDMKVYNAVKIAKTLGISIDELVGADTIPERTKESIILSRKLPENDLYLVRWFIRYLHTLNAKSEPNKRYISVMLVENDNDGNIRLTSNYQRTEITHLKESFGGKIFFGICLNCDNYMPHYSPTDILLIANDRPPKPNENALIRIGKYLYIAKRKTECGTVNYYSIRDGKFRVEETETDELIGYIAYVERSNK